MIRRCIFLAALAVLVGCNSSKSTTIVEVRVNLASAARQDPIVLLRTTVDDGQHNASHDFARSDHTALAFPSTFSLEFARSVTGPLKIEVRGLAADGNTVGRGILAQLALKLGAAQTVDIWLDCFGTCPTDAGAGPTDAASDGPGSDAPGNSDGPANCGNGKVDPGETCDIAVAAGKSGACPPETCDDGIACTMETKIGTGCGAACSYFEIRTFSPGDGCCPANGNERTDSDCSATCGNGTIEPGETCDDAIKPGEVGACPTAADCVDKEACTMDILISANTCSARCVHRPITALVPGDGCCPDGATHNSDTDCPVVCGNALVEVGESCDTGLTTPQAGSCPTMCADVNPCTHNTVVGSGCMAMCKPSAIEQFINGDGCCPRGGNRNVDSDCGAVCGNAVVELGETCDKAIAQGMPGACPAACAPDPSGCLPRHIEGAAGTCSARCVDTPITACSQQAKDGCCPTGCTANVDADCSATCDNGVVEQGETCDTRIPAGKPGACPVTCDDANLCTADSLISGGTCNARCRNLPITTYTAGDNCCPSGGNHNVDPDCAAACGNGIVEGPKETCDKGINANAAGSCPSTCPAPAACLRYTISGDAQSCTSKCTAEPIKVCAAGDGCCPDGCNRNLDEDCAAVCGNGILEAGETCDRGITAGNKGSCVASCDDNNACTSDSTSGRVDDCTRACSYSKVAECAGGDRCCPAGCTSRTDTDCAAVCGNGVVEMGETCDPPSTCPTTCPDDGDRCTADKLAGDPSACTATCTHIPNTTCSGANGDKCCPTGCTIKTDTDCANILPGPLPLN